MDCFHTCIFTIWLASGFHAGHYTIFCYSSVFVSVPLVEYSIACHQSAFDRAFLQTIHSWPLINNQLISLDNNSSSSSICCCCGWYERHSPFTGTTLAGAWPAINQSVSQGRKQAALLIQFQRNAKKHCWFSVDLNKIYTPSSREVNRYYSNSRYLVSICDEMHTNVTEKPWFSTDVIHG